MDAWTSLGLAPMRGDVVARDGKHAVVYTIHDGQPVMLPVQAHNCLRTRADVVVNDLGVMAAMGVGGRQILIRAGAPYKTSAHTVKVGSVPANVMRDIDTVIRRAGETARVEAKYRKAEVAA